MSTPYLIAIAAMSRNRVIGKDGKIPWTCKEDMEWFKRTTMGHPVIMGRKTWEGLGQTPLSGRFNIMISRSAPNGVQNLNDGPAVVGVDGFEWALGCSSRFYCPPAYVIGGAQTYTSLMPWTREILLTVIDIEVDGDTHFPEISDEFELKSTTPLSERAVVHHYVRR